MKKREQLVQDLEKNLQNLNLKVDELENKFKAMKGEMQQKAQSELTKMRASRDKIRYDLTLLKGAGESAFGELEKGVKSAMDTLKAAVDSAKGKFGF